MKIHHIGYLVKKIDKALETFLDLGYQIIQETIYDEYRGIYICFLERDGYVIELVSPASVKSVVSGLLTKTGNSPYHICYEVSDMEEEIQKLRKLHYVICSEPHEAVACSNRKVCFLVHPHMGMIELLEGDSL